MIKKRKTAQSHRFCKWMNGSTQSTPNQRKVTIKIYKIYMAVCQNLVPLVNIKIAGKWMFIPLKMVLIGIDPSPHIYIYIPYIPMYNTCISCLWQKPQHLLWMVAKSDKPPKGWLKLKPNSGIKHLSTGNLLHSYWKWPFIVDFPIKNGDFPQLR